MFSKNHVPSYDVEKTTIKRFCKLLKIGKKKLIENKTQLLFIGKSLGQ